MPVTDRIGPVARPVNVRLAQAASADVVVTTVVATNAAAPNAAQRKARAIIVQLPGKEKHSVPQPHPGTRLLGGEVTRDQHAPATLAGAGDRRAPCATVTHS
jgi:hypothetical protein